MTDRERIEAEPVVEPEQARNRRVNDALLAWLAAQEALPLDALPEPVARDAMTRPVRH